MSWAFNIPFQIVKGESVKTVTAVNSTSTVQDLLGAFPAGSISTSKNYVLKTASTGTIVQYSAFFFQTDASGNLTGYVFRMPDYNPYPVSFTGTFKVTAGDEFYELDRPY